ncbi:pachytene checkpoint protein 2 homolog [Episyrphus balteatus]|uniref:pachytene checkpoint protein 2 homolog n=1 Tax=Episyrphus balteatus TaxID=286459 RepID=UPI0024850A27|nr:pachytene checkpoint protein 2 homolog [Episyrphus balteatus]
MNISNTHNVLHVEIKLKPGNTRIETIENQLKSELNCFFENNKNYLSESEIIVNEQHGPNIQMHVKSISIDGNSFSTINPPPIVYHIYRPHTRNVEVEMFQDNQEEGGEEVPASNHWLLPSHSFDGLWENLIYEDNLKENLLKFAESSLVFSAHNVNQNVISCNRIVLLHGPPGTGKTSLCKAIAQKLSIRLMSTYKFTHLIEINSHSLFSKWFSESGKLVMKLFTKVREIIAQPKSLVCVLIDEVESIAYARESMSGQEPKDAMRVVNALLTQLDSIKESPNVLILATSNLASNIDLAFLDRADIKQHIGLPSVRAIYQIYVSMLRELMRVGMIHEKPIQQFQDGADVCILKLAKSSVGVSGRTLRKLPFLAHAMFMGSAILPIDLECFVQAMQSALDKHLTDQRLLEGKPNNN